MNTQTKIALGWQLNQLSGWGVHGYYLAKRIAHRRIAPLVALEPVLLDTAHKLPIEMLQHRPPQGVRMVWGSGNRPGKTINASAKDGDDLIAVFEDTFLDVDDITALSKFRHIVTITEWNAEVLRGVGFKNVAVAPLGVDAEVFNAKYRTDGTRATLRAKMGIDKDAFVVFSGGKAELRKGQDIVIAAFKVLRERHPDAKLLPIWQSAWPDSAKSLAQSQHGTGAPQSGPEAWSLRIAPWLASNGLPDDSVLMPLNEPVPNHEIGKLLSIADIALFPNRCEAGLNMVAMECMAAALPCILSNNSGHSDLIKAHVPCFELENNIPRDFGTGLSYWREPDLEEVIEALEFAYTHRDTIRSTGDNASSYIAEKYSWDATMDAQIEALGLDKIQEDNIPDEMRQIVSANSGVTLQQRKTLAVSYMQSSARLRDAGKRKASFVAAQRAYRLDSENPMIVADLALAYNGVHKPDVALSLCKMALKMAPELIDNTSHNMGVAQLYLGQFDEAIKSFDHAARKGSMDAIWDKSVTLMRTGRWEEGWDAHEIRRLRTMAGIKRHKPEWHGDTPEAGKTIWVTSEQGHGDIMQFARYLPLLKPMFEKVIFSTHATLMPLFYGYPGVDELRLQADHVDEPIADLHVPLMTIPRYLKTRLHNVPQDPGHFLTQTGKMDATLTHPPGTLKVGIVWAGSKEHLRDWERSMPLEELLPLAENPNVQLYAFQVGSNAADIKELGAENLIVDLSPELRNWTNTAAALTQLDLLVSVDTATAHLAAALNVPTWLMICKHCDWRWLTEGEETPWYPAMRLMRQPILGEWKQVVTRISHDLEKISAGTLPLSYKKESKRRHKDR